MTVTLIGYDYTETPCVKVTRGTYDPATTRDGERHKFLFSSKWANNLEVCAVDSWPAGISKDRYFPDGATHNTFTKMHRGETSSILWKKSYFQGLRYNQPVFSYKRKKSNGRWDISQRREVVRGEANVVGRAGGYIAWGPFDGGEWALDRRIWTDVGGGNYQYVQVGNSIAALTRGVAGALVVFNLPGDATPLDGPAGIGPAKPGSKTIEITPTSLKVAKPGYTTASAARYMAFSSENSPAQAIAADDIAIPGKAVTKYNLPLALDANTHVEVVFYDGSSVTYPSTTAWDFEGGIEYWISGSALYFNNPNSQSGRARFIVLSYDGREPTSGNYDVLRHFTWNGEKHVQFLRPGSANPPRLADIALDTRFPAVQIIKEGYFKVGNGAQVETISYDSAGYLPYVLFMCDVITDGERGISLPFIRYQRRTSEFSGDCAYCVYTASRAKFYTYRGRPMYTYIDSRGDLRTVDVDNEIIGIRYYVFGIPT